MLTRRSAGYVQMTSLGSAVALSSIPTGATAALIMAETQTVRWRDDATSPTTTVGMQLVAGATLAYEGDLSRLRFIEETGSAKLNISYYE